MMMTFLPLEAFVKELLVPNQNGSTAIDSARTMNPSLAIDIETFLFSHGVLLTENPLGFVVASSITSSTGLPSTGDPHLTRTEVGPSRYVICSNKASTVGLTLRAMGIHFAATKAVYMQQVRSPIHAEKLLAFSESDTALSVAWSGCKIAVLAKEKSFRAAFKILTPCKNADQQLAPGMSVLLDLENLSPPPSAETSLMVLRLYPSAGTVDSNTKTHHKATISASGVRVADLGYRDEDFLKGFRRGWYKSDKYFRTVGDHPNRFLSGGDASNSYKFNIHERDDFGYDKKRVMIELPDEGVVFCRGVGDDPNNPEMACVLFDSTGNVRDRYAYRGKLGRWNDIVQ